MQIMQKSHPKSWFVMLGETQFVDGAMANGLPDGKGQYHNVTILQAVPVQRQVLAEVIRAEDYKPEPEQTQQATSELIDTLQEFEYQMQRVADTLKSIKPPENIQIINDAENEAEDSKQ